MKYTIIAAVLFLAHFAEARDAGTITLTPSAATYDTQGSGIVFFGNPDVWTIDLTAFSGPVLLTVTLADYYPPLPDDYDVSLGNAFIGNTLTAAGRTFQVTVPAITNQLRIAYVNAHTGLLPHPGGSLYNLRIVASGADPDPLTSTIATYAGIKITGIVGATYRIEYTFSLDTPTWIQLAEVILPSSPYIHFDLVPINETPSRFYRVSTIQQPTPNQALPLTATAVTSSAYIPPAPPLHLRPRTARASLRSR